MATLVSQPSLSGTMPSAVPQYRDLGNGFTDRIFLLGHGPNTMPLNDPYQVVDIIEAINFLNIDSSCPLMRGLMELYYGGARDIFLVSVAPMSEYQSDITLRDNAWYQTYSDRLNTAYDILLDWDLVQIVLPLNAPFYDAKGVDFLTPLANHCGRAFDRVGSIYSSPNTGTIRMGIIGTATGPISQAMVNAMAADPRIDALGDDGKFVAVVVGEGVINISEFATPYSAPLSTSAAAELSQLPYNRSLSYVRLRNTMNLQTHLNSNQIDTLSEARLNAVDLTTLGYRNQPFQTIILTDNTLSTTGSDFWSLVQVRLSMHIINTVRALGRRYMGMIGFGQFKQDVQNYFLGLMASNFIKECKLNIQKDDFDPTTVNVDIAFTPYFGIRQINFVINVGPQN